LKIAFVSRWGVQCGIATYTDQLVNAIFKVGPECECAAEGVRGLKEIKTESRVVYDRCWDGRSGSFEGIFQFMKSTKPDIIHFQHEFGLMDAAKPMIEMMGRLKSLRTPVVFTCHTVMSPPDHKVWFFKDVLQMASAVVAHNSETKKALLKWGHPEDKITVIPHGTQEDCQKSSRVESRRELFLPTDPNIIMAVSLGFITPGKLQHEGIDAIIGLVREGLLDPKRFLYVIAGSPGQNDQTNIEYCRSLHEMLDYNRAWNYIRIYSHFIPADKLPIWYGAADFVITGSHQTFYSVSGRSHQEMAYGMPSISSRALLLSDLNESRSLKYDSMVQLRAHILAMVRDPNLRNLLSRRCLKFAEETSWTNVADMHIKLYERLTK
jgi:glycosyltransferase involved in cell wall biosynthesis